MKSRFLFAPIPILIVGTLLGLDFWSGGHWGIYLLITATATGCMYEMGRAYSTVSIDVPYRFLTGCMAFLMLFSGYVFLFPSRLVAALPLSELDGSEMTFFSYLFPLLIVILLTVFYRIQSVSSENTQGMLMGLGLFTLFSITYIHAYLILNQFSDTPQQGTLVIIFLLLVSKGTDSGSYLVGKTFGSRQMTPQLSPNKTWMGLFGGLITGVVIGGSFCATELSAWASVPSLLMFSLAVALAAAGGDLIGSLLKRGAGVDDSSNVFPGLGGIMDMTDSFLVTIPVALLILLLLS